MADGDQNAGKWRIKMLGEFSVQKPDGTFVSVHNKRPDALLAAMVYYEGGPSGARRFQEHFSQEIAREQRRKPLTNSQRVSLVMHDDILHTNWVSVQYNLLETKVSELLLQGRGNYGLKQGLWLSDVDPFEAALSNARISGNAPNEQRTHLLKAIGLYSGSFLSRCPLDIEPWIAKPRAYLAESYVEALQGLADYVRAFDLHLAHYCEEHVAQSHPLDEHAV